MNATRISSLWGWIFFVVIVVLVGSVNASGKVIYVDDDASLGGNGQNWATPYRYLQDALGTAVSGDEIRVAEGIYKTDEDSAHPGGTGDREATFQLKNGVAVKGGYAGFGEPVPDTRDIDLNETILSGDLNSNDGPNFARNDENSYHVITSSGTDETTLLDGFTIIGGNANGNGAHDKGGGMFNESGSPTLTGCNFTQNSADVDGGGIYGEYANPVMTDCTFTSNSARNGGAINNRYSNLTLTNCAFSGNMAYHGGGINIFRSSAMLTNCAFSGNLATFGGGIYSYEGNQTLSNCTFTGNSASGNYSTGGAMCNNYCNPLIINCTFINNFADHCDWEFSAYQGGGAIYNNDSSPKLFNCTLSGNLAQYRGGGMYNIYSSYPRLTNCIFWRNSDADGMDESAQIHTKSGNPVINYCCIQNWTGNLGGSGNIGDDPLLSPDGYHLLVDSPCMNAGDPAGDYSGQKDIDGEPRVMLGRIDIGVDESDGMSQLIILTPTRDEILLSGQTYIITWQIPDNTNEILIEYSVDNGRNWNAVDPPNVGNYGSYNWLVPIARSNQCLVRLSDLNNPNVSDVSYDTFTIMSTEGIELKVPTQYATIQTAIDNCYDGDIVVILPGTYTAFGNRDLDFFGKAITVRSIDPNDPNIIALTIIDCNGTEQEPHRGFYFHSGETASSVVEGLTIINGCIRKNERLQGDGGGILCEVSSPTIRNCIITHNVAYGVGGGIACLNSSSPEISNSTISSNIGHNSHGGGIYCFYGSSPKIINCKIINNKASHRGGGVSCRINSSPMISNCFLSANFAGMEGSGLFCYDSEPRLLNCIISDNTVHEQEDAMRFWDSPGSLVSGCIISGRIKITGGTVPITYSNVQGGWSGEGNIGADPCFVSPGYRDANGVWIDGDYHLLQTSACINTADNNSLPADTQDLDGDGNTTEPIPFDIEGNPRIVYDVVDMGPYEFYNTAPIADAGSDQIVECACSTEEGTKVTLDGTNSSDPDRGVLTYTWTGPFDESPAHGVSPTVTLEDGCPGEYVITLVVNDGIDDSEPNDILITVVDTTPPVITCPADVTLQCPADTSVEANGSATAGDTCGTVTITHSNQWQPSCGNTGTLERTWTATDECGNSSNCVQTLTVVDSTPPEFTLSVTPTMLWPPNHKIELITPSWTVSDECDAAPDVSLVGIVANEGDNTIGDGHTSNDIQINEDGSIYLRSERSGRGSDRVYTITYQAMDDCGNITVRNATVSIPHNFKVLARIASRWLWAGQGRIPEDLNGDGFVNLKDIAIFANNWIR